MPTITDLPDAAALRTCALAIAGEAVRVDRDKRTIYGASLMQLGRLNDDRPWKVDDKTLAQALALMQRGATFGTKGRYTHPNMSVDGLGSFLGRWVNPRIDNDRLRADLVLSERAFSGPRGDMGTYILDMAEHEADMLGVSLATRMNRKAMKSDSDADGIEPIRLTAIHSADIVDQPAATRGGMFSMDGPDALPDYATQILDHYFEAASADVIRTRVDGFLDRYLTNRFGDADEMSTKTAGQKTGDKGQEAGDFLTKADLDGVLESFSTKLLGTIDEKLASLAERAGGKAAGEKTAGDNPAGEAGQLSEEQIRTAERQRVLDLSNLARTAGLKEAEKVSQEWVDKNFSLADAKAALGDLVIKQNLLSSGEDDPNAGEDPNAKYKREYRAQAAAFAAMGVTEEEYLTSRQVEDGTLLLAPKEA